MDNNPATKRVQPTQTIDLMELAQVLLRKAHYIIAAVILGALIFGARTHFTVVPMYTAASRIYVSSSKSGVVSLGDLQLGTQLTSDVVIICTSRPVMEQVIEELDLNMSPAALSGSINVVNLQDSRVYEIRVTNRDPYEAAMISNTMAEVIRTRISEIMNTDKPALVQTAIAPTAPIGPNVRSSAMKGGALGFILSAGLLSLLYLLDDTIKTGDDVEKYLGINVLASIPEEYTGKDEKKKKRSLKKPVRAKRRRR